MIEKIVDEIWSKAGEPVTVTATFGERVGDWRWKAQCGTTVMWAGDLETALLRLLAHCPRAERPISPDGREC